MLLAEPEGMTIGVVVIVGVDVSSSVKGSALSLKWQQIFLEFFAWYRIDIKMLAELLQALYLALRVRMVKPMRTGQGLSLIRHSKL
jgi:hypothetical protein